MVNTLNSQGFEFTCRKCGRLKKASFTVPYPIDKKYAVECIGMKNTRWGSQCVPDCETHAKERS